MKRTALRWLAVVLVNVASVALGYVLNEVAELPVTFVTFFPANFVSSRLVGRRGGLLSIAISIPVAVRFLPPRGDFYFHPTPAAWAAIAAFLSTSLLIVELTARFRISLAARDELMAILGHDLKSPLQAITLRADLVRRGAGGPSERLVEHADGIKRQARKMRELVENLLHLQRVRGGHFRLVRAPTDLIDVVRAARSRLELELASSGSSLEITAPSSLQGFWDAICLEQILVNLLGNAIKYGEGRPIEIVVETRAPDAVSITISDHGPGIPESAKARLFEPFGTERVALQSHGLGLWIAKQLAEAHGGGVRLAGREGRPSVGACFLVELPRGSKAASRAQRRSRSVPGREDRPSAG
jgi:signal transduction histidine kinase